jgi:signal peptidase I
MKPESRPPDLWFAEQLEAVAIAIAMALVLKFFVIEAYQIPTGSMQPTILGDAATGIKDRVLADKLCTMLRDPRRWEVMIFRFPLDERRLYVKRIAGLPGETLEILGGDVWIGGKIARKPDHVNESVLKTVFPVGEGGLDIGRAFVAGEGIHVQGEEARFAPDAAGVLRLRAAVHSDYLHGYDPDWGIAPHAGRGGTEAVPDLDLACAVTLDAGAEELLLTLSADEGDTLFTFPREGTGRGASIRFKPARSGELATLWEGDAAAGAGVLPAGRPVRVAVRTVDRETVLRVDDTIVARLPDDAAGPHPARPLTASAAIALRGGGSVRDVVLRRDIFYLPPPSGQTRWELPGDSYFGLGDNTQGSLDSRAWEVKTLVLRDGREYTGFWFNASRVGTGPSDANPVFYPDNKLRFADMHGDEHILDRADIIAERPAWAPFIPARNLLGKAIVVFWPVFRPFRWKLIR